MPIIYVAGPLLQGQTLTFEEGLENWKKTVEVADKLMQKGWTVHVPHHSLFMWDHIKKTQSREISWESWMTQDSGMIKVSQAIFFLGHSKGADAELSYALDNDMKMYTNIHDVPNVTPEDCLLRHQLPSPKPYEVESSEGNINND